MAWLCGSDTHLGLPVPTVQRDTYTTSLVGVSHGCQPTGTRVPSMRTIGNEVDDGRLRRWSGQWRRSGNDGCQLGCCTLVLHRFRALRTSEPSLVRYAHAVGNHRWPGPPPLAQSAKVGQSLTSLWSELVVNLAAGASQQRLLRTRPLGRPAMLPTW